MRESRINVSNKFWSSLSAQQIINLRLLNQFSGMSIEIRNFQFRNINYTLMRSHSLHVHCAIFNIIPALNDLQFENSMTSIRWPTAWECKSIKCCMLILIAENENVFETLDEAINTFDVTGIKEKMKMSDEHKAYFNTFLFSLWLHRAICSCPMSDLRTSNEDNKCNARDSDVSNDYLLL